MQVGSEWGKSEYREQASMGRQGLGIRKRHTLYVEGLFFPFCGDIADS